jgi:hypothetical protein
MRIETKDRRTDRFSVEDADGERYTVSEVTQYTQAFPVDGPPAEPVAGAVRYDCAGIALTRLESGDFELQTDPPKLCKRV